MPTSKKYPYGVVVLDFPEREGLAIEEIPDLGYSSETLRLCDAVVVFTVEKKEEFIDIKLGIAGDITPDTAYASWANYTKYVLDLQDVDTDEGKKRIKFLRNILYMLGLASTDSPLEDVNSLANTGAN